MTHLIFFHSTLIPKCTGWSRNGRHGLIIANADWRIASKTCCPYFAALVCFHHLSCACAESMFKHRQLSTSVLKFPRQPFFSIIYQLFQNLTQIEWISSFAEFCTRDANRATNKGRESRRNWGHLVLSSTRHLFTCTALAVCDSALKGARERIRMNKRKSIKRSRFQRTAFWFLGCSCANRRISV